MYSTRLESARLHPLLCSSLLDSAGLYSPGLASTHQLGDIEFNLNDGSGLSPDLVGAALLIERTGAAASNTTGDIKEISSSPSSSSYSPSSLSLSSSATAAVQAVDNDGTGTRAVVGTGRDLYCFQNSPYDCEAYLGDASLEFSGNLRCGACEGDAFTGIGTPGGAPTPSPVSVDDDDGLSKVGQERAQGGTPSPTPIGGLRSSSSGGGVAGGSGERDPELLGVTGDTRWVVVGLIAVLAGALLVCLCLVTVCRVGKVGRKKGGRRRGALGSAGGRSGGAGVVPSSASDAMTFLRGDDPEVFLSSGGATRAVVVAGTATGAAAATGAGVVAESPRSVPSEARFFAVSPGGTSTAVNLASNSGGGDGGSRRDPRNPSRSLTPLAQRRAREAASLRMKHLSAEADKRAEEVFWKSASSGWGGGAGSGVMVAPAADTPTRRGFAALSGTAATASLTTTHAGGAGVTRSPNKEAAGAGPREGGGGSRSPRHREGGPTAGTVGELGRGQGRGHGFREVHRPKKEGVSVSPEMGLESSGPRRRHGAIAPDTDEDRDTDTDRGRGPDQGMDADPGRGRSRGRADVRRNAPFAGRSAGNLDRGSQSRSNSHSNNSHSNSLSQSQSRSQSRSHSRPRQAVTPDSNNVSPASKRPQEETVRTRAVRTAAGGARMPIGTARRSSGGTGGLGPLGTATVSPEGAGSRTMSPEGAEAKAMSPKGAGVGMEAVMGEGGDLVAVAGGGERGSSSVEKAPSSVDCGPGLPAWEPDMARRVPEENPVHPQPKVWSVSPKRMLVRLGSRGSSRSGRNTNATPRRRLPGSLELGGGGSTEESGWAPELYRPGSSAKKKGSAKVYSGKFDKSRSDWSATGKVANGKVEWSRYPRANEAK